MTELKKYEKGYSPSALQRKYSLSYEQGYEIAEEFRLLHKELAKKEEYLYQTVKTLVDIAKVMGWEK